MMSPAEDHMLKSFRSRWRTAIVATIGIGSFVLLGWIFDVPFLVRLSSSLPATKLNASMALVVSGFALWLLGYESDRMGSGRRILGLTLGLAIAVVGLLSLSEDLFGWSLGIDISFHAGDGVSISAARMSPGAAVNFALLGTSLVLLSFRQRALPWILQTLTFLAFLIAVEAIGGYVYRAHQLYRPMGFFAAIGTGFLSLGVLAARPGEGFMKLVSDTGAAGLTLRRLLPLVFIVPMVLGWVRLVGQRAGLYDLDFGVELLVMSSVICLAVILWWNSRAIHEIERERVQAQISARASSSYARRLIEASLDPLVTINAEGIITDVNQASADATGVTREQLIGTDFSSYFTDPAKASAGYKKVLHDGYVRDYPLSMKHVSGNTAEVLYNASIYRDEQGNPLGVFAAARDITERKRAEQEVKRLLRVFTVLSNINETIVRIHDPKKLLEEACKIAVEDGRFRLAWIGRVDEKTQKVNVAASAGAAARYLESLDINLSDEGRSAGPTGRAVKTGSHVVSVDIANDDAMIPWRAAAKEYCFRSSASFPLTVSGKVWGAFSVYSEEIGFFNDDETRLLDELVGDISFAIEAAQHEEQRKKVEEALRNSEERLRYTMDSMLEGCMIISREWVYLYVNESVARQGHQTRENLIGRKMQEVYPGVEQTEVFQKYEICMNDRIPQHFESKYTFPDGITNWFEFSALPIPEGLFVMTVDISERKHGEEELMKYRDHLEDLIRERTAQLEFANRELEAFSYSVSHDLRAPLRGIDGFSQALIEDYEHVLDAQGKDHLRRVRAAAQRMAVLIDDMLELSRVSQSEMHVQPVDLSIVVEGIVSEIQRTDPERGVQFKIGDGIMTSGDPRLLKIVLENLIGNAWKFTGKTPMASIEFGEIRSGDAPTFFVRDNGVGFDARYADRLFGVFQRLHSTAEFPGTGVGLATVQRIVHRHRGRVWATSTVGQGATFYFTLFEGAAS